MLLRIVTGGIKYILCEATGRGLSEACTLFLPDLPDVPVPFVAFALFSFTAINLSHGYNFILSVMNPSSKSLNWGVVPDIAQLAVPATTKRW